MDGKGRPLRSQRQVDFCDLWRLGFESDVSMGGEGDFPGLYCSMLACSASVFVLASCPESLFLRKLLFIVHNWERRVVSEDRWVLGMVQDHCLGCSL